LDGNGITVEELIAKKSEIKKLNKNDLQNKKEQLTKQQIELKKLEKALKDENKITELSLLSEIKSTFSLKTEIVEQEKKKEIILNPEWGLCPNNQGLPRNF